VSISKAMKPKAARVMGIDASTNSLAFCIMEDAVPVRWGEINFVGSDIYEKINDARAKTEALIQEFDVHFIAIEKAIMVNSAQVGIKLAYVFGTIISVIMASGARVVEVYPIQWQSYIGNKKMTQAEKQSIRNDFPGKSPSWYKAKERQIRKSKTIDFVSESFGITVESDNVADSFGVCYFASMEMVS
jgi:Holliday junction resolvasome RuvABC endonuclease subunit